MYLKSYKDLIVWQKSIELVDGIYKLTDKLPKEETYGLSSQMRRAAVSIPSNIAEGQRRKDLPEFLQFLRIADASSAELETQVVIAKRLYPSLDYSHVESLLDEIQRMLNVLIGKLELKAKSSKLKAQAGFTLIELLIVVAISAVVTTTGFLYLASYRANQSLDLAAKGLSAVLESARKLSMTQEGGTRRGVRFLNSTSSATADSYEVFKGQSYASGIVANTYFIKELGVCFIDPPTGTAKEVVFQPITGYLSSYFSVTIGLCNNVSNQRVIEVTTLGLMSTLDGENLAVQSISPSSGANNGTVSISTVLGANFKSGAAVRISKTGQADISGSGFTVVNYSTINGGSFNIANATTGPWNVVVVNPDNSSSSLAGGFTVMLPAPVITTINPSSGARNSTVSGVSVSGAYFQNGASVKLKRGSYSDVSGTGFTFVSPASFTGGSFNLTGAASGFWDVAVTNPDSQIAALVNGFQVTIATGTIDGAYRYAWNDTYGWWDFATSTSNVSVTDSELTGYAWNASAGLLSLNCSNTGTCATVNYKVANTATGTLSGYAWNDTIGWVGFSCADAGTCGTVNYGVTIDSSGDFQGWAWSDNMGWISFNCLNTSSCVTVNYKVNTTWRP